MPTTSTTKTSTRRLSDVARYLRIPSGIVSSGWKPVAKKLAEWGVRFDGSDSWEVGLGQLILGKRADKKYAATVGGVVLRIPRQVVKTWFIGRLLFALCVLFPGLRVVWTAHHTATLTMTFQSLSNFARSDKVAKHIGDPVTGRSGIKRGSGKEAILFKNGSAIWFGARDQGWGRGFTEIDVLVFDEAQILNPKAIEDLIAAANQSKHPHGALVFYMGTPPRPTDAGDTFDIKRAKALAGLKPGVIRGVLTGGSMLFVECSAHPRIGLEGGPSLDDRDEWRTANPSYPDRTPEESMLRMREQLPSDAAWRREAMGVTDDSTAGGLDLSAWSTMIMKPKEKFTAEVFALDVAPDRSTACITVAGWSGRRVAVQITVDGRGVPDNRPGLDWIRRRIRKLAKDSPDATWVIARRSQAAAYASFIVDTVEAELELVSSENWPAMCASMVDLITTGQALHAGDLGESFAGAVLVNVGEEQFRWGRKKSSIDITPVVAATLAAVTVFREGVPSTGDVLAAFK